MVWTLDPKRKQGDYAVFGSLLKSLAPGELTTPDPLTVAVRQARNRRKKNRRLKLTEAQVKRLMELGVHVELEGLGKRVRRNVVDFARDVGLPV